MNPRELLDCKETFGTEDFAAYAPASILGNMTCESSMSPDYFQLKADIASGESSRNSSAVFKIIEEIIERTLPRYDVDSTYREFVDFKPASRPRPIPARRKPSTKQPEEELSVGDTSSLDAFMGEFTVSKRVGEV